MSCACSGPGFPPGSVNLIWRVMVYKVPSTPREKTSTNQSGLEFPSYFSSSALDYASCKTHTGSRDWGSGGFFSNVGRSTIHVGGSTMTEGPSDTLGTPVKLFSVHRLRLGSTSAWCGSTPGNPRAFLGVLPFVCAASSSGTGPAGRLASERVNVCPLTTSGG